MPWGSQNLVPPRASALVPGPVVLHTLGTCWVPGAGPMLVQPWVPFCSPRTLLGRPQGRSKEPPRTLQGAPKDHPGIPRTFHGPPKDACWFQFGPRLGSFRFLSGFPHFPFSLPFGFPFRYALRFSFRSPFSFPFKLLFRFLFNVSIQVPMYNNC